MVEPGEDGLRFDVRLLHVLCAGGALRGNLIYLSEDIYEAEGVRTLLEPLKVESKISKLKGVRQDLRLFCIAADLSPHLPSVGSEFSQ